MEESARRPAGIASSTTTTPPSNKVRCNSRFKYLQAMCNELRGFEETSGFVERGGFDQHQSSRG